jgi:hypothetical protein
LPVPFPTHGKRKTGVGELAMSALSVNDRVETSGVLAQMEDS